VPFPAGPKHTARSVYQPQLVAEPAESTLYQHSSEVRPMGEDSYREFKAFDCGGERDLAR